jgi:hypothetical protein
MLLVESPKRYNVQQFSEELLTTLSRWLPPDYESAKPNPITLRDLRILDADGNIVDLILNPPQRILMEWLGLDPDDPSPKIANLRWRKRLLKSRRAGFSTLILALMFLDTYNNAERFTASVAHDQRSAEAIFQIVDRFYRHLPSDKKLPAGRANTRELFWPQTNSRLVAATAGVANLFSGAQIANLHLSERSKWPGDAEFIRELDASLKTAARWGNIAEETTANGLNFFYDDWIEGQDGLTDYDQLFVPWYLDPRCTLPVPDGFTRTEEEQKRAEAHSLDDAQLAWYRRETIDQKGLVSQEYPWTAEEAFISSGTNAYFNVEWLMAQLPGLPKPTQRFDPSHAFDDHQLHGILKIYDPPLDLEDVRYIECACGASYDCLARYLRDGVAICPECGREKDPLIRYVAGADACSGVGGLAEGNPHDWSTFAIYRADTWRQVAAYFGRPTPRDFGRDMAVIGNLYNDAEILVENDPRGYGLQAMEQMRDLDPVYPNLRHYNPGQPLTRITPPEKARWGYMVSEKGQLRRDSLLQTAINDRAAGLEGIEIVDERAIREMLAYVEKDGVRGASRGHDDETTAHGLAHLLLRSHGGRVA